VTGLF